MLRLVCVWGLANGTGAAMMSDFNYRHIKIEFSIEGGI